MLKKLKGKGEIKNIITYGILILLILFILVLLLDDKWDQSLYFVCISCGMCSLLVGENNTLSVLTQGLGITRVEIEKKLLKELLILTLNFIILIGFDILFGFIIYKELNIKPSFIILSFLLSLILCLLSLFIKFNYKNKILMIIPIVLIGIIVGIMFIKNKIIIDIILLALFIMFYFVNRYIIYNKEIN